MKITHSANTLYPAFYLNE